MKKILCVLLAASMLAVTGCGQKTGETKPVESGSAATSSADKSQQQEKPVEIKMLAQTFTGVPSDLQVVLDAFNETYAIPQCNVKLTMDILNVGSYMQQLNVGLASGEKFDAFSAFGMVASQLYSVGQIQGLSASMEKYGQGLLEVIPDSYEEACSVNGEMVCIPNVDRSMGSANGLFVRTDLVEKYGFDGERMASDLDYLSECLGTIKEQESSIQYPLVANATLAPYLYTLIEDKNYTIPDRNYSGIGAVLEEEEGFKVYNQYATDQFRLACEKAREWYQAGYLNPNASITANDETQNIFRSGQAFAYYNMYYPDTITSLKDDFPGLDIAAYPVNFIYTATGDYQIFSICVPSASDNVDAVVKLWNMLYTDMDASNMLSWGIEGTHYIKTGADDRQVRYPDGIDSSNAAYANMQSAAFGQIYDGYYLEGTPGNMSELLDEFNAQCPASKISGFYFDPTPINTEMAAVTAVLGEYTKDICNGAVDPSVQIPVMLEALEKAGMDKCMAEFQSQLDAWAK